MGLIVMRHVNDNLLEDLIGEEREGGYDSEISDIDIGIRVLTSLDLYPKVGGEFDLVAQAIKTEINGREIERIYHSGVPRTHITAKALAIKLGFNRDLKSDKVLYEIIPREILKYSFEEKENLVVCHEPSFGNTFRMYPGYAEPFRVMSEQGDFYLQPIMRGRR